MHQRQSPAIRAESAPRASFTQYLARVSAIHPWRILAAWGLILAASVVAIGSLFGSAFSSDGNLTTSPDSVKAEKVIADNFAQGDRIDETIVIHSATLTTGTAEVKAFVTEVRSSVEDTGGVQTISDPYAAKASGICKDGHAAVVALGLGPDPETGI